MGEQKACSRQVTAKPVQSVYVLSRSDGLSKIGISSKIARRRSELQVSTPNRLELFYQEKPKLMPATEIESRVKTLLRPWRVRGEWFKCEARLLRAAVREVQTDACRLASFLDEWREIDRTLDDIGRYERRCDDGPESRRLWRSYCERYIQAFSHYPDLVEAASEPFRHRWMLRRPRLANPA